MLARTHPDKALEYFRLLLESDVHDVQGGTTAEGIHLAAMAGSVGLFQRCFTGLETRGGILGFDPRWPEQLGALSYRLRFRGLDIVVRISSTLLSLSAEDGDVPGVQVVCRGKSLALKPGASVEFALVPATATAP